MNAISGSTFFLRRIVLPIGISFFTFQQIAYLVDVYRGQGANYRFVEYCLFVTLFPQLIAGPTVRHSEMIPQFAGERRVAARDIAVGATVFAMGLFKRDGAL